jgi:hypothetical protein
MYSDFGNKNAVVPRIQAILVMNARIAGAAEGHNRSGLRGMREGHAGKIVILAEMMAQIKALKRALIRAAHSAESTA